MLPTYPPNHPPNPPGLRRAARCFHMARAQQARPWCNELELYTISDTDSVIAAKEMEQNGDWRSQNDKSTGPRVGDGWVMKQ